MKYKGPKYQRLEKERKIKKINFFNYDVNFIFKDDNKGTFYYNKRKTYYTGSGIEQCMNAFFKVMNEENDMKNVRTITSIDEVDRIEKTIYTWDVNSKGKISSMFDNENFVRERTYEGFKSEYEHFQIKQKEVS